MNIIERKKEIFSLMESENFSEMLKRSMDYVEDFSEDQNDLVEITEWHREYNKNRKRYAPQALEDAQKQLSEKIKSIVDTVELAFAVKVRTVDFFEKEVVEQAALQRFHEKKSEKTPLVQLAEICKSFPSSNFKLSNIQLELHIGEITGIIGPNANGKTTLLKIIAGELLKDSGTLKFPLFEPNGKSISWANLKQKIAYIPQELTPWQGSLTDILLYEAARHGILGKDCEHRVDFVIHRLGLSEYAHLSWKELSGGYKLRFELAKALVWKPKFLILDEPLANLDVSAQLTILNDLKNIAHSYKYPIGVFISSQHIHEIEYVADKLLLLERGTAVYFGKPFEFNKENKNTLIELSCNAGTEQLQNALLPYPDIKITDKGYCYIIDIPEIQNIQEVLTALLNNNISIEYFRNISHSVKQIFYAPN